MVVRDIEREDIEFISKTLGCLPVAHIDHMRPEKLGSAELVEEIEVRPASTAVVAAAWLPHVTQQTQLHAHNHSHGRVQ